jgi:anti-sigma-K factor RskA
VSDSRPEPHTLAGAYAMDALDARDQARFERHLARCQECVREVSGLHEATARLAAAAAVPPSTAMKARVLAQTARTRQLPPVLDSTPSPLARRWGPARPQEWRPPARRRARAPRLALGLAGIAVVAAAAAWVAGAVTGPAGHPMPGQQAPGSHAIAAVLTAPDATMITSRVRTGGTATIVMSRHERTLVFAAAGLRALPASQCYELWLMRPGADTPAGLLPMPRHGMTGPVITSGLRDGDRLGMSVEPATGTHHPTTAMILVLTL